MENPKKSNPSGFALLETCISTAVAAILLSSIFTLSAQVFSVIKNAKETSYATQVLEARAEAFRSMRWLDVSTKAGLQTVFSPDAMQALSATASTSAVTGTSTANFNLTSERLIATPYYPPPTSAPATGAPAGMELIRNPNGTFAALPTGDTNTGTSLTAAPAMKVRLTVWWLGSGAKTRQRETITFVSRNGL